MTKITLYEGDNRVSLRQMIARGELVDSVVCDPPYGLTSVTKRFGKKGSAEAKYGTDGAFKRLSGGFMGQRWDSSFIERDPEFWSLVLQVMKPGAYLVAFSSSRTYHHMAVAIEAAGFITHPMIGWTFASGFPKAANAARAIDKALGLDGGKEVNGDPVRRLRPGADQNKDGSWEKLEDREYQPGAYLPASQEAAEWEGWHYGGQARKPALEPIYVGQKPFSEANGALNILKHGVGAVNIDGCRIQADDAPAGRTRHGGGIVGAGTSYELPDSKGSMPAGRWPANLVHDNSPQVVALFPTSKGQQGRSKDSQRSQKHTYGTTTDNGKSYEPRNDEGSAARFFEAYPFDEQPIFHHPKAGKRDRAGSRHPTVKPIALMASLIRHVTPRGGTTLDPFAGSGTTAEAALLEGMNCILMESEQQYVADIRARFDMESQTIVEMLLDTFESSTESGNITSDQQWG